MQDIMAATPDLTAWRAMANNVDIAAKNAKHALSNEVLIISVYIHLIFVSVSILFDCFILYLLFASILHSLFMIICYLHLSFTHYS
jgi:hypothetical protein